MFLELGRFRGSSSLAAPVRIGSAILEAMFNGDCDCRVRPPSLRPQRATLRRRRDFVDDSLPRPAFVNPMSIE